MGANEPITRYSRKSYMTPMSDGGCQEGPFQEGLFAQRRPDAWQQITFHIDLDGFSSLVSVTAKGNFEMPAIQFWHTCCAKPSMVSGVSPEDYVVIVHKARAKVSKVAEEMGYPWV